MSFQTIKGQEKPISILQEYLKQGCLEGGYLFSGPDGIGKQLVALNLAKVVNCQEQQLDACEQCPSCKKIDSGQHPDVHLLANDGGEIKIEFIRQLQKEISLKPYEGRKKIFILDNAHRLNPESSNALLKTLEEPPKDSLIILISDKPKLIFQTIISRCKTVKFAPLKRGNLEAALKDDYRLDQYSAHFLAYFCEGRLGKALRLKDTALFQEKNRIIDGFILKRRPDSEILGLKDRESVRNCLNILATWFRDIYLLKSGLAQAELINYDRRQDLSLQASRFSFLELNRAVSSLIEALSYLEHNINKKLLLYYLGEQLWKA